MASGQSAISELPLDEKIVHKVAVAYGEGVTTFKFPGRIDGIYAQKVATGGNREEFAIAEFGLAYQPGNSYFTLWAQKEKAKDVLTVVCQQHIYQFSISASTKPMRTVTFYNPEYGSGGKVAVTPSKLISLLDKAKLYYQLQEHYPDEVAQIAHARPKARMVYDGFEVLIDDVWRFESEDTLVFRVLLANLTDRPIRYAANQTAVRVDERIYPASVADMSGVMPADSITAAYFAVTGNPVGGRNNLPVDKNWNILIVRETSLTVSTEPKQLTGK
ncbi:MAG: hypothetical protein LBD30_07605 [Verrucomicrobiales bacterium]|nr:hypothetical protein [Verrucomicrobiales bacterium]